MNLARVVDLTKDLDSHKRLAVGASNPLPAFPRESIIGDNITFNATVTAVWTWYHEKLRHDLQFLVQQASETEKRRLLKFGRVLDDQRHFNEHADYNWAQRAQDWRRAKTGASACPDRTLIERLIAELERALEILCAIAARVRQSQSNLYAWRAHESVTPENEIRSVFADIGRASIKEGQLSYAVRRFQGHPALRKAKTPEDRPNVAALIAVEIHLEPLSVKYDHILDEFELLGDPVGHALLTIAHGFEAAGYNGEDLIKILREVLPKTTLNRRRPNSPR